MVSMHSMSSRPFSCPTIGNEAHALFLDNNNNLPVKSSTTLACPAPSPTLPKTLMVPRRHARVQQAPHPSDRSLSIPNNHVPTTPCDKKFSKCRNGSDGLSTFNDDVKHERRVQRLHCQLDTEVRSEIAYKGGVAGTGAGAAAYPPQKSRRPTTPLMPKTARPTTRQTQTSTMHARPMTPARFTTTVVQLDEDTI